LCEYFKLLVQADLFCLDTIHERVGQKDEAFWILILTKCCLYTEELAIFCYANRLTMMTKALHEFFLINAPNINFFHLVSKFRRMSPENLIKLANISVNPMFDFFLALLPNEIP
jgi:hypothetical protein